MNKKNFFCAIIAGFMFWSPLLFANKCRNLLHPLTISLWPGESRIRFAFNQNTQRFLYENGNPLNCRSWPDYGRALKRSLLLPPLLGHIAQANLWQDKKHVDVFDIQFSEQLPENMSEKTDKTPIARVGSWIESNGLAPFVDLRFPKAARMDDLLIQMLVDEFCCHGLPLTLLPPVNGQILSCGDDVTKIIGIQESDRESRSAAYGLASFRHAYQKQEAGLIIAGDNKIDCRHDMEHKGQKIVGLQLDNRSSFREQLTRSGYLDAKFQFVLGRRILCCCESEVPHVTCGGFDLASQEPQVLEFLVNVADVLDPAEESFAFLSGYNPVEFYDFENDVAAFNQLPLPFEARTLRSVLGEFHGILIRKRSEGYFGGGF